MRMKYKRRGRRFTVYEADTPPTLLPCLQSRQPSLNSVDIDSGCSSNNKAERRGVCGERRRRRFPRYGNSRVTNRKT